MGGTILKLSEAGHGVTIVDLTDGEPTPLGDSEKRKKEIEKKLNKLVVIVKIV